MSLLSMEMSVLGLQERRHKEALAKVRNEAEERDRENLEKLRRLASANQRLRAQNEELRNLVRLERNRRVVVMKRQKRDSLNDALERELYE